MSSLILQLSINTNGKKNPGLGEIFYQEEKKKKWKLQELGTEKKNQKGAERRDKRGGQVFKKQCGAYEGYLEGASAKEATESKLQWQPF